MKKQFRYCAAVLAVGLALCSALLAGCGGPTGKNMTASEANAPTDAQGRPMPPAPATPKSP